MEIFPIGFRRIGQSRETAKLERVVYPGKMTDKLLTRVAMAKVRSGSAVNSKMVRTVSAMF